MRFLLVLVHYPLIIAVTLAVFFGLIPVVGLDLAQLPSIISGIVVAAVFERIIPHEPAWNRSREDLTADIALNVLGAVLPSLVVNALTVAALVHLGELVQARVHHALWPGQWPIAVQVMLAVLVAEFFMYWMHRSLHRVGYLWRFHTVHHSAERMYWVNANRVHPVETLVTYAPSFGVLVFLGAPPIVLGAWGALAGIHGIAQHMNTTVRPGRLNFLLSTPELHRWHHSRDRQYADGNYGTVTILWDLAFRTRVLPPQAHEPSDLGVGEAPAYVRGSLWRLLTAPFATPWEAAPAPAQAADKSVR